MAILHITETDIFIERIESTVDGADDIVTQIGYKSKGTSATPYGGASNVRSKTGCIDKDDNAIVCEVYLYSFYYSTEPPGLSGETEGLRIVFTDDIDDAGIPIGNAIAPYERIYLNNFTDLGSNASTDTGSGLYKLEANASNEYILTAEYENREVEEWMIKNLNNTPHIELKCYTKL